MHCSVCDAGAVMIRSAGEGGTATATWGSNPTLTICFLPFMIEISSSLTGWPFRVARSRCWPVRSRISRGPAPPMITHSLSTSTFTSGSSTLTSSVPSAVLIRSTVATNSDTFVSPAASEAPQAGQGEHHETRGHGQPAASARGALATGRSNSNSGDDWA